MRTNFPSLIGLIITLLILVNLFQRTRRKPGDIPSEPPLAPTATGRTTPESSEKWRGSAQGWGQALEEAESKFEAIKEQVEATALETPPVNQDYSDLTPAERKPKAMNYLNARRGAKVKITTRTRIYYGSIVNVTATQVMLRGIEEKVFGVNLDEIETIT